jgi:hypothetical protein
MFKTKVNQEFHTYLSFLINVDSILDNQLLGEYMNMSDNISYDVFGDFNSNVVKNNDISFQLLRQYLFVCKNDVDTSECE